MEQIKSKEFGSDKLKDYLNKTGDILTSLARASRSTKIESTKKEKENESDN